MKELVQKIGRTRLFVIIFMVTSLAIIYFFGKIKDFNHYNRKINGKIDTIIHKPRHFEIKINKKEYSFAINEYAGLEDFVKKGDSLVKEKNQYSIKIYRIRNDSTLIKEFKWTYPL